ncbi:8330_t:CDS:2, partial [Funneliformis geosporum]
FHKDWIRINEKDHENLVYGKAVDTLVKSLHEIANKSLDPVKIQKANNLLKANICLYMGNVFCSNLLDNCGGVTLLAGLLTDLLDRYGNNLDKLWLAIENKGRVLQEKNVNMRTNCIQLVSCEGIQISNVGNKRSHENEESATLAKKNPIVKKLKDIGGIVRYRIIFLLEVNDCNPIKSSFTEEEWLKFETDWQN